MSNVLLGCAIGDSLGMPYEKKLSNDPFLINWDGKTFGSSEHHGLQSGQFTDDTQFSLCVAQSLIDNNGFDPDKLSKKYVDLFTTKTIRGYGRTTKAAIDNLLSGKHWSESGIAESEGNGTAMRSAPFGVYYRNDISTLVKVCKIDNGITHASDEAEAGSIAIAIAAACAANNDLESLLERICEHLPDSKVKNTIFSLGALINADEITPQQALRVLGTKANVKETVPSALYCFLKFDDYHTAIEAAIRAGGDTDTTAAIVGALFGAKLGINGIDKQFHIVEDFDKLVELDSQLFNRSNRSFFPRS